MLSNRSKRHLALCAAISLAVNGSPALAQVPNDLSDLVGAKGRDGETQLQSRGYTNQHASKTDEGSYTYWWNASKKSCVRVLTSDGRYEKIKTVGNDDCGQNESNSSSGNNKAVGVAVGAAALLGVLALAHKSHHRDDKSHDERQTADFERGYRDGLYNNSYHNYDNRREYSDGFSKGVKQRGQESSYRSDNAYQYRGGYQSHVSVSDIVRRDTAYAWGELERRGFRLAGERKLSGDKYQWFYWNPSTRQCVDIQTRGNEVRSVTDTADYACNG
jgi:hypothetical protein